MSAIRTLFIRLALAGLLIGSGHADAARIFIGTNLSFMTMGNRIITVMVDDHGVGSLGREGCISLDTSKGGEYLWMLLEQNPGNPPTITRTRLNDINGDHYYLWSFRSGISYQYEGRAAAYLDEIPEGQFNEIFKNRDCVDVSGPYSPRPADWRPTYSEYFELFKDKARGGGQQ